MKKLIPILLIFLFSCNNVEPTKEELAKRIPIGDDCTEIKLEYIDLQNAHMNTLKELNTLQHEHIRVLNEYNNLMIEYRHFLDSLNNICDEKARQMP